MSAREISDTVAEYELRGIPIEELLAQEPPESTREATFDPTTQPRSAGPVRYAVDPLGEPQGNGTRFHVTDLDTSERIYVGRTTNYGSRRGLSRYSDTIPYDRFKAEATIGAWAHFIYPSVMAESGGRHLVINAWDRAHFTWGFYQLAAHTAGDNLILLMRELVQLPSAKRYFPDLVLVDGKLAQMTGDGPVTLERQAEVNVGGWTETQLPDFMAYLNPSSRRLDNQEVIASAKFIAWAEEDPAMLETTIRVSTGIMKRKIRHWAGRLDLLGKRPELAIWVSDMFHQGRGSLNKAREALNQSTFPRQLQALSEIDTTGHHAQRRATVRQHIEVLLNEGRFDGAAFGEGALALSMV